MPLFYPTVFAVAYLRARGRASGTLESALRAISVLLLFCKNNDINLMERMREGRILEVGELDALVQMCRVPTSEMDNVDHASNAPARNIRSGLETYRQRGNAKEVVENGGTSIGIRLLYIREYIKWLTNLYLLSLGPGNQALRPLLESVRELICGGLTARMPDGRGRNSASSREALSESEQERLWEVIGIDSNQNPFSTLHTRYRNDLAVRWLMGLGIRRGELLGLKVTDINFRKNEVFIARRADDKTDSRVDEPNAKTNDRYLPISDDLAHRTREYITQFRRSYKKARKHNFLFVANGGAALSKRGFNRIFEVLCERVPDLPHIFPHIFRHTHNGNFSAIADERKMDVETEKKTRSQMMGWSETSGTAATYTRREILRKAREASLELQDKLAISKHGKD